jgi:PBP1b-binding outer membrane lipoprotein LpoB/Flp pilus assembly protein TadD
MKQFILSIFAIALFVGTTTAQAPADLIKAASKAVKAIGAKKDKVAAAEAAVEAMMKDPANANSWEALLVKGKLYNEMTAIDRIGRQTSQLMGKPYKSEFVKASLSGSKALLAAAKATQDKKQLKEITSALTEVQGDLNNTASELTDAKDYAGAWEAFNSVISIHDVLKANGAKSTLDKPEDMNRQLNWAGLLSVYSEKEKESVGLYERMIAAGKDTSYVYSALYKVYLDTDKEKAIGYLTEGRKKFPEDGQLLFTEINYYLKEGKLDALIDKLKKGIEKEPGNPGLYYTLGNVYDNLAQKETDEAKIKTYNEESFKLYEKTLQIDPKNSDAIYSIGAVYYNKAAAYSKEMKKLESDFSKEGQKKYDAAEKLMKEEFEKALPYFQKAEALNPNDQNSLVALKEIYARKGDMKTSGEMKTRIETVQGGGKNAASFHKQ